MDRSLLRMRTAAVAVLALAIAAQGLWPAVAQQQGRVQIQIQGRPRAADPAAAAEDGPEQALDGVLLPANRDLRVTMRRAEKALEDNRNTDAVQLLSSILQGPEDYFFQPDPKQPLYRSMKAEAQRLIGEMSAEGRQSYELQFGAEAKRQLHNAVAAGDTQGIENVSRQFLHTDAGYDATLLLARQHLDHGRPLAAALCLQRLQNSPAAARRFEPTLSVMLAAAWRRSGLSDKAQDVLVKLKENNPGAKLRIAGKPVALFRDDGQALAWLDDTVGGPHATNAAEPDQWCLFRGNPARNAVSAGGQPMLRPRWALPTNSKPDVEKALLQMQKQYLDANLTVLPGAHPLAVRDVVLMRTASNLLAVDFVTGKRIWGMESKGEPSDPGIGDNFRNNLMMRGRGMRNLQIQVFNGSLTERSWDNATCATLSSDGECVYSVEELPFVDKTGSGKAVFMVNGVRKGVLNQGPEIFNKLVARELRTQGKLKWEVGGATSEYEPQLAGAFFLGPPLPLQDRLYVLAEIKGEIRLVVLQQTKDPVKPVRVEWSQQLAQVEQTISIDSLRRTAGATPSFADGVLVCPTSAGVVVGVDLTTRSLLWGYKYLRGQQQFVNGFPGGANMRIGGVVMQMGQAIALESTTTASDRWNDGCATIADGRILVTPIESDQLHCISLIDGTVQWKLDRGENLYVACVHKGTVIVVGRHEVQAVRLSDGRPAWKKPLQLADTGMPSGRGFYSGDDYYLPLTTAGVAKIDLDQGAIKQIVKSWRGNIPGNLICYKGQVISLGVEFLEAFYQLEPLKEQIAAQLAANPDNAEALARRGEIQLIDGKLPGALTDLRHSYQLAPDAGTRDLLVEALLASLHEDFAVNRDSLDELEKLIELPAERAAYLRLLAVESRRAGDLRAAIKAYLQLADLDSAPDELEPNGSSASVRRDRWIYAQLSALTKSLSPENQAVLDAAVSARLKTVLESKKDQLSELRSFLNCFGGQPASNQARDMLASKLSTRESLLEKEFLLRQLEQSSDPVQHRAAVARLAILLADASRWDEATIYYRQLAGEYADQPCLGGRTGRQLVAEIPPGTPIPRLLDPSSSWPSGAVEVTPGGTASALSVRQPNRPTLTVPLRGVLGPFFNDTTLTFDRQQLVARGPLGKERFRISLQDRSTMESGFREPMLAPNNYAFANGHLLVAVIGTQVVAMDTLRSDLSGDGVLWRQDLVDQLPNMQMGREVTPLKQLMNPWGAPRFVPNESGGPPLGTLGLVTDNAVCLQRSRDIYGLHPLTGETLWIQRGLPQSSELFGDDAFLFVAGPDETEATVMRVLDGELLGKRVVPPTSKRLATFGRRVLTWTESNDRMQLILRDPWEEKNIWAFDFSKGTKADIVDDEAVGVMEPSGHFLLMTVADGRKLVEEQLEPESQLKDITVLRCRDQYHLIANQVPQPAMIARAHLQPLPQNDGFFPAHQQLSARVYAFDRRTGKKQWTTPAEISLQYLLQQLPSELPVLPFFRLTMSEGQQAGYRGSILCLDKRTGRVAYQREDLPINGGLLFDVGADLETHTVSVLYSSNAIALKFTDNPRPPEPPPQSLTNANGERPESRSSARIPSALLRAFSNGIKAVGEGGPAAPPDNNAQPQQPVPAK